MGRKGTTIDGGPRDPLDPDQVEGEGNGNDCDGFTDYGCEGESDAGGDEVSSAEACVIKTSGMDALAQIEEEKASGDCVECFMERACGRVRDVLLQESGSLENVGVEIGNAGVTLSGLSNVDIKGGQVFIPFEEGQGTGADPGLNTCDEGVLFDTSIGRGIVVIVTTPSLAVFPNRHGIRIVEGGPCDACDKFNCENCQFSMKNGDGGDNIF